MWRLWRPDYFCEVLRPAFPWVLRKSDRFTVAECERHGHQVLEEGPGWSLCPALLSPRGALCGPPLLLRAPCRLTASTGSTAACGPARHAAGEALGKAKGALCSLHTRSVPVNGKPASTWHRRRPSSLGMLTVQGYRCKKPKHRLLASHRAPRALRGRTVPSTSERRLLRSSRPSDLTLQRHPHRHTQK